MITLFTDECGYTGPDLLQASQPVFVLATHSFEEDECVELVNRHFASVRASELKHVQLCRRRSQQDMLLSFLRDVMTRQSRFKCAIANKLFVLATKVVDLIIEP